MVSYINTCVQGFETATHTHTAKPIQNSSTHACNIIIGTLTTYTHYVYHCQLHDRYIKSKSKSVLSHFSLEATFTGCENSLFHNLADLVQWVDTPIHYRCTLTTEDVRYRVKDFEKALEVSNTCCLFERCADLLVNILVNK